MGTQLASRTVLRLFGRRLTAKAQHNPGTGHVVLTLASVDESPLLMVVCNTDQARWLLAEWRSEMDRIDGITRPELAEARRLIEALLPHARDWVDEYGPSYEPIVRAEAFLAGLNQETTS